MKLEAIFRKDDYTTEGWRQMQIDAALLLKFSTLLSEEELSLLAKMLDERYPEAFRLISELAEPRV